MDLTTLKKREPIYDIITTSIENFAKSQLNNQIADNSLSLKHPYYVYESINTITTIIPSPRVLRYVLSEYNNRTSIIKFLAGKLLVLLLIKSRGIFSNRKIYLPLPKNQDILIWPCNRTIRLFDFKRESVLVLLKEGYDGLKFQALILFRKKHEEIYDFIPRIYESGEFWYSEEILKGQALARIKQREKYIQAKCHVIMHITNLRNENKIVSASYDYLKGLLNLIKEKIEALSNIQTESKSLLLEHISSMFSLRDSLFKGVFLDLGLSHGDLQEGNIWVGDQDVKILDWEFAGIRSNWYDPLTLELSLRRQGWLKRLRECPSSQLEEILTGYALNRNSPNELIRIVVELETIEFYLSDILSLPLTSRDQSLISLLREVIS